MLNKDENDLIDQTGPGTPMGNLMRQYWMPSMMSCELPSPDCPPVRIRILNENLIAFRTTSGKVGVVANACPHRGASLFFGRNEEEGLRCVYHGWKFDVAGNCIDMPSEPAESNFKNKVHATAYPTQERGGLVWIYMGPRAVPPPLPDLEVNMLPEGQYSSAPMRRECNWLQSLEGDYDTIHVGFLHQGSMRAEDSAPGTPEYYVLKNRWARYTTEDTAFGCTYGCNRPAEEDTRTGASPTSSSRLYLLPVEGLADVRQHAVSHNGTVLGLDLVEHGCDVAALEVKIDLSPSRGRTWFSKAAFTWSALRRPST